MNEQLNNDYGLIREFLEYYGDCPIPDPEQYPKRFEFMVKTFQHYKKMKGTDNE